MKNDTLLEEGFRWYGPSDPVTLTDIVQCGAAGVYTALHDIAYGQVWPRKAIRERLDLLAAANLKWLVVESVPVSEAIKTRGADCDAHIKNYQETLQNLAAEGVNVVVYNFMPVLDWIRTDLSYRLEDGSEALLFDPVHFAAFEIFHLKRDGAEGDYTEEQVAKAKLFFEGKDEAQRRQFERNILDVFPGCDMGLSVDDLRAMLATYDGIDAEQLRSNYRHFLQAVIPVAERCGVRMAVHPDDPPFSVLGLPRIVCSEKDLVEILAMAPSPANGLCFCAGSLGARKENDLKGIVERLGSHIHAVHLRSVQHLDDGSFYEANHLEGCANLPVLVEAFLKQNAKKDDGAKLSFRPDHGHRMLDDLKKSTNRNPGYDCLGRMRGLAEIRGVQAGVSAML